MSELEQKIEQFLNEYGRQHGYDNELLSRIIAYQVENDAGWQPGDWRVCQHEGAAVPGGAK